jgi:hypothetical protein
MGSPDLPLVVLAWLAGAAAVAVAVQLRRSQSFRVYPNALLVTLAACVAGLMLSSGMYGLVGASTDTLLGSAASDGAGSLFCRFQGADDLSPAQ